MPVLVKNNSQRSFTIKGQTLKAGETSAPMANQEAERLVSLYPQELSIVGEITVDIKVDAKDVIEKVEALKNDPEFTEEKADAFIDSIKVDVEQGESKTELVAKVTADAPVEEPVKKKRGRKPKNAE